jgi:hypothetical protein
MRFPKNPKKELGRKSADYPGRKEKRIHLLVCK